MINIFLDCTLPLLKGTGKANSSYCLASRLDCLFRMWLQVLQGKVESGYLPPCNQVGKEGAKRGKWEPQFCALHYWPAEQGGSVAVRFNALTKFLQKQCCHMMPLILD